jgi:hypothetical protein
MITGVSLKGANTALVLLQQTSDAYHPIALAITGDYNRLGCIDSIAEDANTELVLSYFLQKHASGELVVDAAYLRLHDFYPITDLERLLACFERNMNDNPSAAVLNGQPLVFALICRVVWDALARSLSVDRSSLTNHFQDVFKDDPVAEEIYRGNLTKTSEQLSEFVAVSDFLAARRIAWKPADDPGQDYPEEMRQYLKEAKQTFRDSAVVLEALQNYEGEVGDLLQDE